MKTLFIFFLACLLAASFCRRFLFLFLWGESHSRSSSCFSFPLSLSCLVGVRKKTGRERDGVKKKHAISLALKKAVEERAEGKKGGGGLGSKIVLRRTSGQQQATVGELARCGRKKKELPWRKNNLK